MLFLTHNCLSLLFSFYVVSYPASRFERMAWLVCTKEKTTDVVFISKKNLLQHLSSLKVQRTQMQIFIFQTYDLNIVSRITKCFTRIGSIKSLTHQLLVCRQDCKTSTFYMYYTQTK